MGEFAAAKRGLRSTHRSQLPPDTGPSRARTAENDACAASRVPGARLFLPLNDRLSYSHTCLLPFSQGYPFRAISCKGKRAQHSLYAVQPDNSTIKSATSMPAVRICQKLDPQKMPEPRNRRGDLRTIFLKSRCRLACKSARPL
jgi:hypothetical protein